MKITSDHPASLLGRPVILDDDGKPMEYAAGLKAYRKALGLSVQDLADMAGCSRRTVENWEQGRPVPAAALNVMASRLR